MTMPPRHLRIHNSETATHATFFPALHALSPAVDSRPLMAKLHLVVMRVGPLTSQQLLMGAYLGH